MISKVSGQRWAFNNTAGGCDGHVKAQFMVEIVTTSDYSNEIQVIQSSSRDFKVGAGWSSNLDKECDNGCYQYLVGQDKPKT